VTPRGLRLVTLGGLACVVVGLVIALATGQTDRAVLGGGSGPSLVHAATLGWILLIAGVALAAGVAGFLLGVRWKESGRS
jgi:hypothetical protein